MTAPTPRCGRCANGTPHIYEYGLGGYTHHRCRCQICVDTWNRYQRGVYYATREKRLAQCRAYRARMAA